MQPSPDPANRRVRDFYRLYGLEAELADLQVVKEATEKMRQSSDALRESRTGLHEAIIAARARGATLGQIARVSKMSRQRISQILQEGVSA